MFPRPLPLDLTLDMRKPRASIDAAELILAFFGVFPRLAMRYPDMRREMAAWVRSQLTRPGRALDTNTLQAALVPSFGVQPVLQPRFQILRESNDGWVGVDAFGQGTIHFRVADDASRLTIRVAPSRATGMLSVVGTAISQQEDTEEGELTARYLLRRAREICLIFAGGEFDEAFCTGDRLRFRFDAKDPDAPDDLALTLISALTAPLPRVHRTWKEDSIVFGFCLDLFTSQAEQIERFVWNSHHNVSSLHNMRFSIGVQLERLGYAWGDDLVMSDSSGITISFSIAGLMRVTVHALGDTVTLELDQLSTSLARRVLGLTVAHAARRTKNGIAIAGWLDSASGLFESRQGIA